ncbi:hypothetical protein HHK36_009005 [Tetracentron sinense]|uniref:Uncharacterized protein n=1 Tax=Tetracentron sinense TaxID=13715 RepID=A0A834ZEL3_TETSI|nr:hypothetical protein HHK36_009005 [Tetracentron sinense]
MPHRQCQQGPLQLRTSSSDSDSLHHRPWWIEVSNLEIVDLREAASSRAKLVETTMKLSELGEELEASKANGCQVVQEFNANAGYRVQADVLFGMGFLNYLHILPSRKKLISILHNFSGIMKPCRMHCF